MKNPLKRKKEFFKKILKELKNLINLKIEFKYNAGWSSLEARQAHNLKVGGSNPSPATSIMIKKFENPEKKNAELIFKIKNTKIDLHYIKNKDDFRDKILYSIDPQDNILDIG